MVAASPERWGNWRLNKSCACWESVPGSRPVLVVLPPRAPVKATVATSIAIQPPTTARRWRNDVRAIRASMRSSGFGAGFGRAGPELDGALVANGAGSGCWVQHPYAPARRPGVDETGRGRVGADLAAGRATG